MAGMLAAESAMELILSGEATHDTGVVPTLYEDKLKESYVYKELKVSYPNTIVKNILFLSYHI